MRPSKNDVDDPTVQGIAKRNEQRREPRFPANAAALLRPITNPGPHDRIRARVLDISKNGMKVRVGIPLLPGTGIHLILAKSMVMGHVRYCRVVDSGFELGVAVEDTFATNTRLADE